MDYNVWFVAGDSSVSLYLLIPQYGYLASLTCFWFLYLFIPVFFCPIIPPFPCIYWSVIVHTSIIIIIWYGCLMSQAFSSWYFSWTSGDPHHSGFKLHTAVLSILCVLFQVQLSFVVNLSNVFLVQLPYFSLSFSLLLLLLLLLTAIGLSPSSNGYFTCIQNMKLVTTKFKSGGLHEKHVVAIIRCCLYGLLHNTGDR